MTLTIASISFAAACAFVSLHHRHHKAPVGHKFSIAVIEDTGKVVGVAIVGRPVSRMRDDGQTLEVTRLCTDGTRNACSKLYGACARAAFALGYRKIGTYIRADESGASLRAVGWRLIGKTSGRKWDCQSRPRTSKTEIVDRLLWEAAMPTGR